MRIRPLLISASLLAISSAAYADTLVNYTLQGTSSGYNPVTPSSGVMFATVDTGYATYDVDTGTFLSFSITSHTNTPGAFRGDLFSTKTLDSGTLNITTLGPGLSIGSCDDLYYCLSVSSLYPASFAYNLEAEPYMVFFNPSENPDGPAYDWGYLYGNGSLVPSSVTPEPSAFVLLGTGLLGIAGTIRRRLQS